MLTAGMTLSNLICITEAYFALDEAAAEMTSQFETIQQRFNETNEVFDKLKTTILSSISSDSDASKFDNIRLS